MLANRRNGFSLSENATKFIDLARWLAAMFVVADHIRHGILVNKSDLSVNNIFLKILYGLTTLGHSAVIVFFILSGFLVGGLVLIRMPSKHFDIKSYFIKRFSRIYIVLIPALLVGITFDYIGRIFFNAKGLYTKIDAINTAILPVAPAERMSFINFIDNLLLLQFDGALGSNGPLWSLAFEWWYYMIFGCALVALSGSRVARIWAILALCGMAALLPADLLLWGGIWLMGTAVALFAARFSYRPPLAIAALIAIATIPAPRIPLLFQNLHPFLVDAIAGFGFSLLLLSACRNIGPFTRLGRLNLTMAQFSYSLYLTHFPMLILIMGMIGTVMDVRLLVQPTSYSLAGCLLIFVFLVGFAYIFSSFTEAYTNRAAEFLSRMTKRSE